MEASTTLSSDAVKEDEDSKNLAVDVTQGSASHPSERNLGSNDDGDGAACGSTTGFEAKKLSVKEQTEADMANLGKRARKRLEKCVHSHILKTNLPLLIASIRSIIDRGPT